MWHPEHHVFSMGQKGLADWCAANGMQRFRAAQIASWIFDHGIDDPQSWTNLSARDRDLASDELVITSGRTLSQQRASDGTQKLLVEWDDDERGTSAGLPILGQAERVDRQTECVMIPSLDPDSNRRTACISSQVGCPVGCKFCASGLSGLDGNLSAGRIIEQVWQLDRLPGVGRVSNVVFMGMGEPLSNFDAVTQAIRVLAAPKPWGMGIGARKITVSTVGLPKYINRLAEEFDLPITLALSLHAPTDDLRRQLIPWSEYTTIDELLEACGAWFDKTGREITLEYTLLGGTNDSPKQAGQLAELAMSLRANINLIRYNEVQGLPFRRPADSDVRNFQGVLRDRNINAHIRASRGRDIAAACGQLRHEHESSAG